MEGNTIRNREVPLIVEDLEDPRVVDKILNPNQRQLLADTRRFEEKVDQLTGGNLRSASDLYIRPRTVETDEHLLDTYDSFYLTTKSLLVMFQVMGIMPLIRTKESIKGPRTTYNWLSPASYWSYFVFACETLIVVWGWF